MTVHSHIHLADQSADPTSLTGVRVSDPLTLTIFGASGDLTRRKLMPALFTMYRQGFLPERFAVVGFARRPYDDAHFRHEMAEAIQTFSRGPIDPAQLEAFLTRFYYFEADLEDEAAYVRFREFLSDTGRFPENRLFYLSIRPDLFDPVVDRLKKSGVAGSARTSPWTRVVIEKPFGRDLESALELNRQFRRRLGEEQIYRIDHYLGKETVQNILSFRFANTIFEPVFNNRYVDHVQITASETVGMENGRGAYYDQAGALRDMVQNHLLQLLCLVAMEPPAGLTADAIRSEKVKVLQSVKPLSLEDVVRAQYTAGQVGGQVVPGYREEDRVPPDSRTETYIAMRLQIANWRWAGVPFYLRTGKRLPYRATEIVVRFKTPPLRLFQTVQCEEDVCDLTHTRPNTLVFRIQPKEGITLNFSAKRPVLQVQVENVEMDFSYADTWKKSLPEAYERLLLDVMRGDSTLFMRSDEVEAAWRIVDPLLKSWTDHPNLPMAVYPAGSWGPQEAESCFHDAERYWRRGE